MKRKTEFLLLTCHSDAEITDFLQRQAESGWRLAGSKGNRFEFERRPYNGSRVCSFTFASRDRAVSTEEQLRRELPDLRRQGWDTICISGPENITDSRRHAFLCDERPDSANPRPLPRTGPEQEAASRRRSRRKAFSNLALCVLCSLFFALVARSDLIRIASSDFYLVGGAVLLLALGVCLALSILSASSSLRALRDPAKEIERGGYRRLDVATRSVFAFLVLLCCFLLVDSVWNNPKGHGPKTTINGQDARPGSDGAPARLEDLGLDCAGPRRATAFRESSSFISSYRHVFDDCFGSEDEVFVSCTAFSTRLEWLRETASRKLFPYEGLSNPSLALALGLDSIVLSKDKKKILLSKGASLMLVESSFALSSSQIDSLGEKVML